MGEKNIYTNFYFVLVTTPVFACHIHSICVIIFLLSSSFMPTGPALRVGQYLDCVIEEVKNDGRILRLSVSQSDVTAAIATDEQKWTMNNLLPGLVVKAQIQKVGFTELTGSLSQMTICVSAVKVTIVPSGYRSSMTTSLYPSCHPTLE